MRKVLINLGKGLITIFLLFIGVLTLSSCDDSQDNKYVINGPDEISISSNSEYDIGLFVVDEDGNIIESRFIFESDSTDIMIDNGVLKTSQSFSSDAIVTATEINTGLSKTINIKYSGILTDVYNVYINKADGAFMDTTRQQVFYLNYNEEYAFDVKGNLDHINPKDYISIEVYGIDNEDDVHLLDYNEDTGKFIPCGLGSGILEINVKSNDKILFHKQISFEIHFLDNDLGKDILDVNDYLTYEDLQSLEEIKITNKVKDLEEVKYLPNIKRIVLDSNTLMHLENKVENCIYRVRISIYEQYLNNDEWADYIYNIYPFSTNPGSEVYLVYHNDVNHKNTGEKLVSWELTDSLTNGKLKELEFLGYVHQGWNKLNGSEFTNSDLVNLTSDGIHLFANWRPIQYTVKFIGNDYTSGSMENIIVNYDEEKEFPESGYLRTGYNFEGWLDENNNLSNVGDKFINLTATDNLEIIFNAKWVAEEYAVSFESSAIGFIPINKTYTFDDEYTLYSLALDGYEFVGYEYNNQTYNKDDYPVWNIPSDCTITMLYSPISYNITYHLDDGENDSSNPLTFTIEDSFELKNASKEGYTFIGWHLDALNGGSIASINSCDFYRNIDLYAIYSNDKISVTFNALGGTVDGDNTRMYEYDKNAILPSVSRTGYSFAGWFKNYDPENDTYSEQVLDGIWKISSNITLYAKWTEHHYTLVIDLVGGEVVSGEPLEEINLAYSEVFKLNTLPQFQKLGQQSYKFYYDANMNNTKDASETEYLANDSLTKLTAVDGKVVYVRLIWSPIYYYVQFSYNKMTFIPGADLQEKYDPVSKKYKIYYGEEFTIPTAQQGGFTVSQWTNGVNIYQRNDVVSSITYEAGATIIFTASTENMEPIIYNVNYVYNGVVLDTQQNCHYDSEYKVSSVVAQKDGYKFDGWKYNGIVYRYEDEDTFINLTEVAGGSITMEPKFDAIHYYVVFYKDGSVYTNIDCDYDEDYSLSDLTSKKTGYTQTGFSINGTSYGINDKIKNLTTGDGLTVRADAVYRPNEYTIRFYVDGVLYTSLPATYDVETVISQVNPKKTGYTLASWTFGNTTYTPSSKPKNLTTEDGDYVDFHANFSAIPIGNISFTGSDDLLSIGSSEQMTVQASGGSGSFSYYITNYDSTKVKASIGVSSGKLVIEKNKENVEGYVTIQVVDNVTGLSKSVDRKYSTSCVTGDTLVTMADGTQKMIKDVKVGDLVQTWNFYTGSIEIQPVTMLWNHGTDLYYVLHLIFDDGREIKMINNHGFFDVDRCEFIFITRSNYNDLVGDSFVFIDEDGTFELKLVDAYVTQEVVDCYSLRTAYNDNALIEGAISLTREDFDGITTAFTVKDDLTYDQDYIDSLIEQYGLFTYDDWKDYMSEDLFEMFNGRYYKIYIGLGILNEEDILPLLAGLFENIEENNAN